MAEYNRFISYIYLYERGMKTINTGFAKVESRGGQCRINVMMKNMYHESHVKFSAYMFVRKGNKLVGIYLGDLKTENNTGEFDKTTDADNIENSGYGLEQAVGMIIRGDNGKIYGTGWDDDALNVDAFVTMEEYANGTAPEPQESVMAVENDADDDADAAYDAGDAMVGGADAAARGAGAAVGGAGTEAGGAMVGGANDGVGAAYDGAGAVASGAMVGSATVGGVVAGGADDGTDAVDDGAGVTVLAAGEERVRRSADDSVASMTFANAETMADGVISAMDNGRVSVTADRNAEAADNNGRGGVAERKTGVNDGNSGAPHLSISGNADGGPNATRLMAESMEAAAVRVGSSRPAFSSPYGLFGNLSGSGNFSNRRNSGRTEKNQDVLVKPDADTWKVGRPKDKETNEAANKNLPVEDQQPASSVLAKIIDKGLRMYPFEDEQGTACIRMEPQDIGMLPMKYWPLANNSFLLHGYYSYRHLILARISDGRYILGVPGVNYQREQFMAGMFGFDSFKPVQNHAPTGSEFGYWYMELEE